MAKLLAEESKIMMMDDMAKEWHDIARKEILERRKRAMASGGADAGGGGGGD